MYRRNIALYTENQLVALLAQRWIVSFQNHESNGEGKFKIFYC